MKLGIGFCLGRQFGLVSNGWKAFLGFSFHRSRIKNSEEVLGFLSNSLESGLLVKGVRLRRTPFSLHKKTANVMLAVLALAEI